MESLIICKKDYADRICLLWSSVVVVWRLFIGHGNTWTANSAPHSRQELRMNASPARLYTAFPALLSITQMIPSHSILHILTGIAALVVLFRGEERGSF